MCGGLGLGFLGLVSSGFFVCFLFGLFVVVGGGGGRWGYWEGESGQVTYLMRTGGHNEVQLEKKTGPSTTYISLSVSVSV